MNSDQKVNPRWQCLMDNADEGVLRWDDDKDFFFTSKLLPACWGGGGAGYQHTTSAPPPKPDSAFQIASPAPAPRPVERPYLHTAPFTHF